MSTTIAPLGEALRHRSEFITIDDLTEYRRCRVQVGGRGVVLRDIVPGSEIRTKKQQVCRKGEFLVAEIDAKMGGFGLVPPDLEGAVVSSHYFLYDIDEARLLPRYLHHLCASPILMEQVRARGSTNYAAVRPHHVLDWRVPLPSLDEQRRIVHRLDAIWIRLADVEASIVEREESLARAVDRLIVGAPERLNPRVPMNEVVEVQEDTVQVVRSQSYHFAGIKSFGKGMFDAGKKVAGEDFKYDVLVRLREGHLVYPKLMAWEGALAVVPPEFDGKFVSPEFVQFRPTGAVAPEVLDAWFRSSRSLADLKGGSTGTNVRRNRLMPATFLRLTMPCPSRGAQRAIQRVATLQRQMRFHTVRAGDIEALRATILARAFSGRL